MRGPSIIARSLSRGAVADKHGNAWQYMSRSDRHSKVACWAILFDLLSRSKRLIRHVESGELVFGINHQMIDFKQNRKKDLDLVLCTPLRRDDESVATKAVKSFAELAEHWKVDLSAADREALKKLPSLPGGAVGSVRVALEAKAAMTAHVRALPRLFDELNSSHLTIHGATDSAIAVGFVLINLATEFISSDRNRTRFDAKDAVISTHRQPDDALRVLQKVRELPRRTKLGEVGYDAIGALVVDCRNDGSPVTHVTKPPAPAATDILSYGTMIERIAEVYETRHE